ncbi:MAG: hypothetical protein WCB11_07110 [Terriglobales bacterium]
MAGVGRERPKRTSSEITWVFILALTVCALIGVFCIFGSAYWKHEFGEGTGPDVARDLGIALLIAVFVTISIELYAGSRLRQQISYDVLSAGYAKLVPEKVFTQINDSVFKSDVIRNNWQVHITGNAEKEQLLKKGTVTITASYYYEIENLKAQQIPYDVLASIDIDDPPPSDKLPFFERFAVYDDQRDQRNRLVEEADVNALTQKCPSQINQPLRKGNLTLERVGQALNLTAKVKIPARSFIRVNFAVQREIRVPGNYVLSSNVPADGIEIMINVTGFKLTAVPLHPHRQGLIPRTDDTSHFDAAILPWQGFRFVSEVAPSLQVTNQVSGKVQA